jgi:putative peptidoglycan lipid II flippase
MSVSTPPPPLLEAPAEGAPEVLALEAGAVAAVPTTGAASPTATSRRVAGAALVVMAFFIISRFTGLAREIIIGARFGTSAEYDAYLAAFRVPDLLFQLVAGGALGSAFIPVFAGYWIKGERPGAWLLFSRVLNLVTLLLIVLATAAILFAQPLVASVIAPGFAPEQQALTAQLMRIMLTGTVVFGASGLVMAALNATQHFLWPAAAPVIYNLAIIGSAWWLTPRMGVAGLAWGVVAGAVGHLLVQLPQLMRTGVVYTPSADLRDVGVREVLRLMGPRVLGLFFVQMQFVVNTILASGLAAGSLSALNYAWLIMLLPLGIFAQSVATAVFPTFAAQIAAGDADAMRRTLSQTLRTVLFLIIPSAVGLITFGSMIVRLLLERGSFTAESTALVAFALAFYALGLVGHASLEIMVRAFYALHNTWTPVLVGVGAMVLNILLSIWWVRYLGFGGLALANSVATLLETLLLLILLRRRLGGIDGRALAFSAGRTALAAAIMGAALYPLAQWAGAQPEGVRLLVDVGALLGGVVLFIGASALLRAPELGQVMALARRR